MTNEKKMFYIITSHFMDITICHMYKVITLLKIGITVNQILLGYWVFYATFKKYNNYIVAVHKFVYNQFKRGRHGHDRMVVGCTTTCAISAYQHRCYEFESRSG